MPLEYGYFYPFVAYAGLTNHVSSAHTNAGFEGHIVEVEIDNGETREEKGVSIDKKRRDKFVPPLRHSLR
jgi:hypothetical protein